jgi:hypothetical protein
MLRAPLAVSRMVVVSDEPVADRLRREHPGAAIRHVPLGFGTPQEPQTRPETGVLRVIAPGTSVPHAIERAVDRARLAGASIELLPHDEPDRLRDADLVLALEWPPETGEPPVAALAGMAAARAVVVFETEGTARWPAFDPQTWGTRALVGGDTPLVVSIDPRDEEHSLVLTLRRMAADQALVRRLGAAGHAWWRTHATLAHASAGWQQVLGEAAARPSPARPAGWPEHLEDDATMRARRTLEDFQIRVDFLR